MGNERVVAVAIDDSEYSLFAFEFYVENVHKPGDHLVLIHVPEYNQMINEISLLTDPELMDVIIRHTEEGIQELVNAYSLKMRDLQIDGHVRKQYGKPGEAIIEALKEEEAKLLIIGTRGRGFIKRTFLGSVSDYCLHHCTIPVIVCKHKTMKTE